MTIEKRYNEVRDSVKKKQTRNNVFNALRTAILTSGRNAVKDNKLNYGIGMYDMAVQRADMYSEKNLQIIKAIRDINPDASLALWNFQRLSNQGHEVEALLPNGDVDERATAYLNNELAPRVGMLYRGGMDMLVNVLNLSTYTYGANALEVELNEGLNEVVDFHAVLPTILEFRLNKETGMQELGIMKDGEFIVLNTNQVFYSPIDPDVDEPYGRSPLLPTLNSVFFQVAVLNDLKAVMHHQGHARFDIQIMKESMYENLPPEIEMQGDDAINAFLLSYIESIKSGFADLGPDDDFVHDDSVNIGMVGGTQGSSMDATSIIAVIDKQVTSSLKHLPILLGRSESTSETHATIQWQIFKAGIRSMQKATERTLENAYNIALRIKGFQSKANVEFNELNVTDRAKEATAEEVEIRNLVAKVQQGWITNDEAANLIVGHDAVAEPVQVQQNANFLNQPVAMTRQTRRLTAAKTQDEYIREMGTDWADEVSTYAPEAIKDTEKTLNDELKAVIKKVEVAGMPPAEVLVEAKHMQTIYMGTPQAKLPPIPNLFQFWVESKILTADLKQKQLNLWDKLVNTVGQAASFIAGKANLLTLGLDIEFDKTDKQLQEWLTNRSKRNSKLIRDVNDETVLKTLWEEVYSGKYSVPSASKRLQEAHNFSPSRAKVIARTEIIGAAHSGQYHSDKQSGIVVAKTWKETLDSRTREDHVKASGQTVAFDDPFIVGGEKMLYPSDDSLGASARNIIQCRCFYTRVLEGEDWEAIP